MPIRTAVSLSYKIIGEYPDTIPILLFHELLGCKKHWEGLGKTMLNMMKRSVIAVDLRNHGDSPHVNSHKYEEMASDVLQLIKKLSISKACLLGHSMGGRTSMYLSLIAPQHVAALIVVDTSPISNTSQLTDFYPDIMTKMKEVDFKHPKTVNKARKVAKRQLKKTITDDIAMFTILSNVNMKTDGTIGWTCNLDILIKQFKHIAMFPKIKTMRYLGPTLFIGGQFSEHIPPDDLTGIRTFFPQAVIHYVPKAGHHVHIDDPKTFLELVIKFVKNTPLY
ncbi:sn-1-specific diacylglycerol lipase ABHD11-like [Aphomia sociella]